MTMNCERIESSLLAVVDGRATREERERVEEHAASCEACTLRNEQMRGIWSELDRLPALEPSAAFDARLRARLAAGKRLAGPTVVETTDTTIVVHPGRTLRVDAFGNF